MSTITLYSNNNTTDITIISNTFIDQYMPAANGSYVKVYLYLLRCLTGTSQELDISYIADQLEDTEKDILRAIGYWEKTGLISTKRNSKGSITEIMLNTPVPQQTAKIPLIEEEANLIAKPIYSTMQIKELTSNEQLKWSMNIIEVYLEHPLRSADVQLILYLYESVGFSAELIMYLYEYCLSKGKKSVSYIEKVALSWAEKGFDTVEKAEASTIQYNNNYNTIAKAFGLAQPLRTIEKQFIDNWINTYKFDLEIIIEACNRTILCTQKSDFNYANKILKSWYEQKVKNLDDIKRLDENYNKSNAKVRNNIALSKTTTNKFNAFPQRNYTKEEFNAIEEKLLKKQL